MKFSWVICIAFLLAFISPNAWGQSSKPLTELKPVDGPGALHLEDKPFSLMGKVMHFGLGAEEERDVSGSVYDLAGKYTRFEAWVGVSDAYNITDREFSIRLDGKMVMDNKTDLMKSGDAPIHVSVDVTGIQSLRLHASNGVFFGEPILYRATPALANIANLVAPQDGMIVSATSANLLWEPVNGATGYGVEIVCTKGSSPHIYALNATDSTAKFDLTGVANGEYHWSIIAFNRKGAMGKFSKDRTFIVAR